MQEWRKIFDSATGTATNGQCPACLERRVGRQRQFGDLELLIVEHALEGLPRPQDLDVEIDALWLDPAVDQRAGAVIVPAGERKFQIGH